jgi:DNA-directed RNA polymerase sigma subunit (sigma70/sigma32)
MTASQATAEVFFTVFKTLSKREQEVLLTRIVRDRKLHRMLENLSDRLAIEQERDTPSKPLRVYIKERERRERSKAKTSK